jgi:hypothetical protein
MDSNACGWKRRWECCMNSDHKVREASWTKISNIGASHISIATYIAEGG